MFAFSRAAYACGTAPEVKKGEPHDVIGDDTFERFRFFLCLRLLFSLVPSPPLPSLVNSCDRASNIMWELVHLATIQSRIRSNATFQPRKQRRRQKTVAVCFSIFWTPASGILLGHQMLNLRGRRFIRKLMKLDTNCARLQVAEGVRHVVVVEQCRGRSACSERL